MLNFSSYSNKESEEEKVTYNGAHDTSTEGKWSSHWTQIIQIFLG